MPDPPTRQTLLLLDGHSLAFRAFFALPDSLRTRTGQLTNAVYGFTSMLIKMIGEHRPDGIVVCFDKGRDVARTEAYPDYKAGRAEAPDEFRTQLDLMHEVLQVLEVPVVEVPGVEADDVIATLAARATREGHRVLVVTGDRDAMQMVGDGVTVLYTLRGITETAEMTPQAVVDRYGIGPDQYPDYAALRGDTSDNLPGVPGVGEKTAARLIATYGDLEGVYQHLDEVAGKKLPQALREHRDQVFVNRRLMRLRRDVEVDADLASLRMGRPVLANVQRLFSTLEFTSLWERLQSEVLGARQQEEAEGFELLPRRMRAGELAGWLADVKRPIAVLPVTEGRVPDTRWTGVGLAAPERDPVAASLGELAREDVAALSRLLADPDVAKVVHDRKLLDHAAHARGWRVDGVVLDTVLAAYLVNPDQGWFDLERLALQHLNRSLGADPGSEDGQLALDVEEPGACWEDRALRALATLELAEHLRRELDLRGQTELLRTVEMPLAPVLAGMERTGIAVDLEVLADMRGRLAARCEELEREIWDLAGERFNVGSTPQLQEVLFERLGLPKTKRIKTGYSTDAASLESILTAHQIVEPILEWRELSKLVSTYLDALPPLVHPQTGRVHTTLSQVTAATGRLSSARPNLQNIPVRREEGREIRRAFVPGEGYSALLVADYSQIELRIMAHLSGDAGLLEAFASGEDIHATTAATVFDVPLTLVDGPLRDRAKAVNYGLAYGLTPFGLSQQLGIPPEEARQIVDAYMARFPQVGAFLSRAVLDARRDGFTTTLFGRRRYLPDLLSSNRNRRSMAERMALNAPIQGAAADIIKLAMVRVYRALERAGLGTQLLLQVHDELVFEVADDELDEARELVVREMCAVADLRVPLEVDTAWGPTWFDAQKH
ncbi:MAG TPA: DNA polymerase I [Nitriliruptorales bacterium]|nr:DNA polymerase I [Nitriliruptorales bacterium]